MRRGGRGPAGARARRGAGRLRGAESSSNHGARAPAPRERRPAARTLPPPPASAPAGHWEEPEPVRLGSQTADTRQLPPPPNKPASRGGAFGARPAPQVRSRRPGPPPGKETRSFSGPRVHGKKGLRRPAPPPPPKSAPPESALHSEPQFNQDTTNLRHAQWRMGKYRVEQLKARRDCSYHQEGFVFGSFTRFTRTPQSEKTRKKNITRTLALREASCHFRKTPKQLYRDSHNKELRPPANIHVIEPCWKWILQLQPSIQMTKAPAHIFTATSLEILSQNHPAKPYLNS
ncbi:uncharacterized protein [Callorhinus ursinus]|uniref:uncharacterized protein n=1 Tax=Callorhinus ursinus TaxID=34884 RepID=UPI003CD03EB4